jgi:dihydrofolate reductase
MTVVVYYVAASADGFIAPLDGSLAWLAPFFSRSNGHSPRSVLRELQARDLRRAWLVGGGELAGAFQAEGLISEYIISIIPVILGAGIPLFGSHGSAQALKLIESKTYPSGVAQLKYALALSRAT